MSYSLYILLCKNNKLYTGIARDPEKRFLLHCEGKGAKYTQRNKPIKIVYIERFRDLSSAMRRERQVKKLSRKNKDFLINSLN